MVLDSYHNFFDIEYCMFCESRNIFNVFVIFILYFLFDLYFTSVDYFTFCQMYIYINDLVNFYKLRINKKKDK